MVLDKAYKKVVASIMALCMASTMMLYTPSGNLINEVLVDATITSNSGGFAFNDTGGKAGSSGNWVCSDDVYGYRVYPVSLTAMLSNDATSVEDTIAKYDKCSIFISNVDYSNHNQYYHNTELDDYTTKYTLIEIDSNQYLTNAQCSYWGNNEEGTFERFLSDAFSVVSTETLTTKCNDAIETAQKAMDTKGNQRMLFDSYMDFLVNTCGLTEDSLYTDLQNMFATNCTTPGVTSESDFMLIVEPMCYIHPGTVSKGGYMSLMESLKVIRYFDRNSDNATKLPANVFTGEKMSMIDKSTNGWHYSGFAEHKCWASTRFYPEGWDNPAANASCYIYPFRHILPKLDAEKVTDTTLLDRINGTKDTDKDGNLDGQYAGFCWYSLSNGGVHTTNTYSITEEASVITDGEQTDFLEEEILNLPLANGGTETVNVKTALMNGIISNETITKNYYRRTTEEENRDTILKALNLETLKEANPTYDTITLSSDIENAKSNSQYNNFYYSVSPFQQGEKIDLFKTIAYEEDHKDYVLGQTANTGSINTTGKLNYSNLTEITDKTLLSNMENVMKYTVDSTDDYKLDLEFVPIG